MIKWVACVVALVCACVLYGVWDYAHEVILFLIGIVGLAAGMLGFLLLMEEHDIISFDKWDDDTPYLDEDYDNDRLPS